MRVGAVPKFAAHARRRPAAVHRDKPPRGRLPCHQLDLAAPARRGPLALPSARPALTRRRALDGRRLPGRPDGGGGQELPALRHVALSPPADTATRRKPRPTSRQRPDTGRGDVDEVAAVRHVALSRPAVTATRRKPCRTRHSAATAALRQAAGTALGSDEAARPTRSSGAPLERIACPARARCRLAPGHGPRRTPTTAARERAPSPTRGRGGPRDPPPPGDYLLARTGPGTPGLTGAEACLPRSR